MAFGYLYLLFGKITAYLNKFHAVEQGRGNTAKIIGCGYEHYIRQVVVDVKEIVMECIVLFRVEYLKKCR